MTSRHAEGGCSYEVVAHEGLAALVHREVVEAGVAPSATVAWARRSSGGTWRIALGAAGCRVDAIFDLASVTKPLTAIAALRASTRGRIALGSTIGEVLPALASSAAAGATLEDLLSHRAGMPAWGAIHREDPWASGAPASLSFEGAPPPLDVLLRRAAGRCDGPNEAAIYSDLGYVLAGAMVERSLGSGGALAREWTAISAATTATLRRASDADFDARTLPTEVVAWRGGDVRGAVHDENAFAIELAGATPGHAGAFGTAEELARFGAHFVEALEGRDERWLPRALAERMIARRPGGTHTLGWDTPSIGASSSGARFGARAIGHLGFTGTSVWIDPEAHAVAVLLSNRTYPTRDNVKVREARPRIHDALWSIPLD
ncbi:MAG: serine hydrolase domain-containing protein [Polyangiales bacterium]